MRLTGWGYSDTGRKRNHNEDSYLVDDGMGLFAVADGMGGHRGGATASRLALDVLHRHMTEAIHNLVEVAAQIESARRIELLGQNSNEMSDLDTVPALRLRLQRAPTLPSDASTAGSSAGGSCDFDTAVDVVSPPALTVMHAAALDAGVEIFQTALADQSLRGMGTTLTAMLYDSGRMHIVHAGDSRAYLLRNGKLDQLTEDHTWIAEQVRLGTMTAAEAKESKYRHIITRSVGFERDVELDTFRLAVEPGDCFLLCSDGLSNYIQHEELEELLAQTWFRRAPRRLIDMANDRGGDDNITAVVIHAGNHADDAGPEPMPASSQPGPAGSSAATAG